MSAGNQTWVFWTAFLTTEPCLQSLYFIYWYRITLAWNSWAHMRLQTWVTALSITFLIQCMNKVKPSLWSSDNLLQQKVNNQLIYCYIHTLIQAKCMYAHTYKQRDYVFALLFPATPEFRTVKASGDLNPLLCWRQSFCLAIPSPGLPVPGERWGGTVG